MAVASGPSRVLPALLAAAVLGALPSPTHALQLPRGSRSLSSDAGGSWTACTVGGAACMPAAVPGTALVALIANGSVPSMAPGADPYLDECV
jgi:hypothetical protein